MFQSQFAKFYQCEGYRVNSLNTDGARAQVELLWDERFKPRCGRCSALMRINRKTRQSALDLPLASADFVAVVYEAVQGFCSGCRRYHTVRPLEIVEHHQATLRLMRRVSHAARWMPLDRICELYSVTPSSAYRYDRYILQTELPAPDLEGLCALLIDEKMIRKGTFITLVLNAHTGELLFLAEGRDQSVLAPFFERLTPAQKQGILAVGLDRSASYRAAVEKHLPQAEIVLDKFHLVANYHEVIDKVRRRSYAQADQANRAFIKGQRYNLFRNPCHLSPDARSDLKALLEANLDLNTLYVLREEFKRIWTYSYRKCAENCLVGWARLAIDSGIRELQRFAEGLLEVKDQITSYCKHRITSARIEAFNSVISKVIHKCCGVSNLDYLFLKLRQESLQN